MEAHDELEQSEETVEDLEVDEKESAEISGGGKVHVHDISITKFVDKSSPSL